MTLLFEMTEESQDQIRIDVGKVHVVGRFTELSRGEAEEQTKPIAVAGDVRGLIGALCTRYS